MRFLVDESTGRRLNELLKRSGFDSLFVGDVLPGSDDETVLLRAENERRVLITDDKDFGELVFRLNRPTSGVILFRGSTNPSERVKVLSRILGEVNVENSFTTIKEGKFKIRKL